MLYVPRSLYNQYASTEPWNKFAAIIPLDDEVINNPENNNQNGNSGDDNQGGNQSGNSGDDNQGGNQNGNSGDDNQGGNQSGNSGDDNQGGNQSGNSGNENQGGNQSGNSGDDSQGGNNQNDKDPSNEDSTGIESYKAGNDKTVIYSLGGNRVSTPVKGFNIINGKKVYVK